MESGVATQPIEDWIQYVDELNERMGSDNKIVRLLINRAKTNPKKIVFAEADHLAVLKAAQIVLEDGIGIPVLLGRKEIILELMSQLEFDEDIEIIDPKSDRQTEKLNEYATIFWKNRKRNGITLYEAKKLMRERNYYAAMMLDEGDVDAMISGYSRSYSTVLKPVLETIGKFDGVNKVAATNLMLTKRGPIFISDTSINIEPTAKELAKIAQMTNYTMKMFGLSPVIAMISYANFGSSKHPNAKKVKEAVEILHKSNPDMVIDGGLQTDFALNPDMLKENFPFSKLAGKKVNALIFPNLDSANSNYKLLKELNNAESIGPIMLGMRKSVHILQLGASVEEIVNMAAVSVVDAQQKEKRNAER
jgi:malate dehydrogenase (oxaloacetate-decarboxylating)(NADP+)